MEVAFTVKNTFLDIASNAEPCQESRRCSSLPPAWKPGSPSTACEEDLRSDVSTTDSSDGPKSHEPRSTIAGDFDDSVDGASLCDATDQCSDHGPNCAHDATAATGAAVATTRKTLLCLEDVIPASSLLPGPVAPQAMMTTSTRLRSTSRAFNPSVEVPPVPQPGEGALALIEIAGTTLTTVPGVSKVTTEIRAMGATIVVTADIARPPMSSRANHLHRALDATKTALLDAASLTQSTYIVGYLAEPFVDISECSFSATVSCIPKEHQDSVCWDMYLYGHCHRRPMCRWRHLCAARLTRVFIVLREIDEGARHMKNADSTLSKIATFLGVPPDKHA